ncbi:hypothetical protein M0R45_029863 [Rubus argutus]|uniref:Uncharacterized protein n=1 Tax=Rubus argutus TaxID=59490 RepID=A0AAW1W9B9_RUBAR
MEGEDSSLLSSCRRSSTFSFLGDLPSTWNSCGNTQVIQKGTKQKWQVRVEGRQEERDVEEAHGSPTQKRRGTAADWSGAPVGDVAVREKEARTGGSVRAEEIDIAVGFEKEQQGCFCDDGLGSW